MTQTPSPHDRFGFAFITLARQWHRVVDTRLAEAGLSDATWRPLVHLAEGGDGISQRDLAARISLDTSTLVRLLDLLEARGLVERRQVRRIFGQFSLCIRVCRICSPVITNHSAA